MSANNPRNDDAIIGIIHSCFPQKFGIPRQPRLAPAATAYIELLPPWHTMACVQGLEAFSHIWLLFRFHRHQQHQPSATVRPPRLGGNQRVGVFATRSSFRPNHIGMSAVRLIRIEERNSHPVIHISGVDILDQTPLLDIKPYIPYSDAIAEAHCPWQEPGIEAPVHIHFSPPAEQTCHEISMKHADFRALLIQILSQDPRPAYHRETERRYHMQLWQWDVHFYGDKTQLHIESITPFRKENSNHEP